MIPDCLSHGVFPSNAALPHFAGLLTVAVLATLNERLRYSRSSFLFVLWHLFGVVLHELSHLLVGLLFAARPVGFSVFPRRQALPDGSFSWILGSVSFTRLNAVNSLPVALAPLLLVWAAFEVFRRWTWWFDGSVLSVMGLYSVVFGLLYNAMPSRRDFSIAAHPVGLGLYAVVGAVALAIFRK